MKLALGALVWLALVVWLAVLPLYVAGRLLVVLAVLGARRWRVRRY